MAHVVIIFFFVIFIDTKLKKSIDYTELDLNNVTIKFGS